MDEHMDEHAGPEASPSGKKPRIYGEVMIKVWITGDGEDTGGEAVIETPPNLPFEALIVAAEHLLTAAALRSEAGFEKAVELIAEGALSNKGRLMGGPDSN